MATKTKDKRKRHRRSRRHRLPAGASSCIDDAEVVVRPTRTGNRISDKLCDLVQPFVEDGMGEHEFRALVCFGALAWNLALDGADSDRDLQRVLDAVDIPNADYFKSFVRELIERKQALYATDNRFVVGWEVTPQPDGRFYVSVAAGRME